MLSDPATGQRTGDLCYAARGFSLHAARRVSAYQRGKLEELLRHVGRSPGRDGAAKEWNRAGHVEATRSRPECDGRVRRAAIGKEWQNALNHADATAGVRKRQSLARRLSPR